MKGSCVGGPINTHPRTREELVIPLCACLHGVIPNDFPFVLNLSLPDSFCPYKANLFDNPVLAIEVTEVITESLSWNSR